MKHTLILIALLMLIATAALAQIPKTMSFQGQLTDGDGNPVVDGLFDLTFRLYDAASDGMMLWEETHQQVDVLRGLFNVILGSSNALNLPFDKPYWLGITIRTDAELKPRTALTSSPYSLNAPTAGTTGDGHSLDAADGDPTDVVFVDAAGKVGIGTAAPGSSLHIQSSNAILRIEDTDSQVRITMFNSVATPAADVGVGRINFRGNDNGGTAINYAQLNGVVTDDTDTSEDGYFTISTMQAGTLTESVRVDHAGNVGIGTKTPGQKLSVDGVVESVTGGFRFPDGTVQTTAATGSGGGGLSSVATDATLSGDGTSGSPLQLAVPLVLTGSDNNGVVRGEHSSGTFGYLGGTGTFGAAGAYGQDSNGNVGELGNNGAGAYGRHSNGNRGFLGTDTFGALGEHPNGNRGFLGTKSFGAYGRHSNGNIGYLGTSNFGGLFIGPDNDGTNAAVSIRSSDQTILLDGNEIDAVDGTLFLNNNSHGSVRIGSGPDNDGTKAALEITSTSPTGIDQTMLIDGNEIDATVGTLFLNFNSSGDVDLGGGGGNVVVNTTIQYNSDRRLKKNITTLDGALDQVLKLRGVRFEWKKVAGRMSHPPQGVQLGVVAQEVEAVVPELVKTDAEGYKSVAYANITALLIEAVKAQQTTIAAQHAQMEELRSRVDTLESLMSQAAMLNK